MPTTGRSGFDRSRAGQKPGCRPEGLTAQKTAWHWVLACIVAQALACGLPAYAADETPFTTIANLATALSENDSSMAMSYFDSQMKSYGTIAADVQALADQTDVTCAIDVVTDVEANGVHKLDLDWFMDLKTQNDLPQTEQRRERIHVEMKQIKGRWKITAMSPLSILGPIQIK